KEFLNVGLPICQIWTNTGTVSAFAGVIMGFSEICGVSISIPKLIVSGVAYFIISIAAPPIPGGSISVMAILMSQALLPDYCLAIYIAVNVLLDMLLTSVNIASNVNNLVCAASALDMISKKE
ncbi:MAG: dicarboxylate/amino acid:cation symporter, partial [Acidaminococcaceae bacterium]|nr:dicarboxylate/amino acid:cation symporter [Acidaminococcaceae bacterium]